MTPDTNPYLFLGLGVILVVLIVYGLSLLLRFRSAQRDAAVLESLRDRS